MKAKGAEDELERKEKLVEHLRERVDWMEKKLETNQEELDQVLRQPRKTHPLDRVVVGGEPALTQSGAGESAHAIAGSFCTGRDGTRRPGAGAGRQNVGGVDAVEGEDPRSHQPTHRRTGRTSSFWLSQASSKTAPDSLGGQDEVKNGRMEVDRLNSDVHLSELRHADELDQLRHELEAKHAARLQEVLQENAVKMEEQLSRNAKSLPSDALPAAAAAALMRPAGGAQDARRVLVADGRPARYTGRVCRLDARETGGCERGAAPRQRGESRPQRPCAPAPPPRERSRRPSVV